MEKLHSQYTDSSREEILLQLDDSTLHSGKAANDIVVRPQPFIKPRKPLTQKPSSLHFRERLFATFNFTSTSTVVPSQHKS